MNGVDIMNKKTAAYRLDCKSKYRFYLSMFLDLMDVTQVNSHIFYMKLGNNILLLNFKIVVAKAWIGRYSNCNRSFSTARPRESENLMNRP